MSGLVHKVFTWAWEQVRFLAVPIAASEKLWCVSYVHADWLIVTCHCQSKLGDTLTAQAFSPKTFTEPAISETV